MNKLNYTFLSILSHSKKLNFRIIIYIEIYSIRIELYRYLNYRYEMKTSARPIQVPPMRRRLMYNGKILHVPCIQKKTIQILKRKRIEKRERPLSRTRVRAKSPCRILFDNQAEESDTNIEPDATNADMVDDYKPTDYDSDTKVDPNSDSEPDSDFTSETESNIDPTQLLSSGYVRDDFATSGDEDDKSVNSDSDNDSDYTGNTDSDTDSDPDVPTFHHNHPFPDQYFLGAPIQYSKQKRNSIRLMKPVKLRDGVYIWNHIAVRLVSSVILSVFAKLYLRPGMLIPILGMIGNDADRNISPPYPTTTTYPLVPWVYTNNTASVSKGYRSTCPDWMENRAVYTPSELHGQCTIHESVPLWGLGIHTMIQRTTDIVKSNAVFWNNHILIFRRVDAGKEVKVFDRSGFKDQRTYLKEVVSRTIEDTTSFYASIMKHMRKRSYETLSKRMDRQIFKVKKRYQKLCDYLRKEERKRDSIQPDSNQRPRDINRCELTHLNTTVSRSTN